MKPNKLSDPQQGKRGADRKPRRYWSKADRARLMKLYPALATKEVAKRLNRTIAGVYGMADKIGLAKAPEYLQRECRLQKGHKIGRATQFPKGHEPANKGLRRPGYSVGRGRMQDTQFKKGCRSGAAAENWRPIGTILPDPEGYLRIKVREAEYGKEAFGFGNTKVWPLLSRVIWQRHKGPIPAKHIVKFKDGDRSNCVIENLYLLSMADNMRANSIWKVLPRELVDVIQLNARVKRQIRRAHGEK